MSARSRLKFFKTYERRVNGVKNSYSYYGPVYRNWQDEVFKDNQNPRWKSQVSASTQAGTSFHAIERDVSLTPSIQTLVFKLKANNSTYDYLFDIQNDSDRSLMENHNNLSSYNSAGADNTALSALSQKLYKYHTSVEGGVMLGELRETIQMLRNPALSLRRGVNSYLDLVKKRVKVNKREKISRLNSIVADTWLEAQYGWKPLMSDIRDVVDLIHDRDINRARHRSFRATGRTKDTVVDDSVNVSQSGFSHKLHRKLVKISEVRYIAKVEVSPGTVAGTRRIGLSSANILPTVWELVPYSFLVDYFSNVGNIIQAVSNISVNVSWVIKTTRKRMEYDSYTSSPIFYNPYPTGDNYYFYISNFQAGNCKARLKEVWRDPYYGSLVPSLQFSLPGSSTKYLNIAALISASRSMREIIRKR